MYNEPYAMYVCIFLQTLEIQNDVVFNFNI